MRIVAGKYKGKILNEFTLDTTRPTSDIVRSSLFNIIGDRVVDSKFLDLFGGTGACGIEACSRSAKEVVIVDNNLESIKIINKNVNLLKPENIKIVKQDYVDFLDTMKNINEKFDIVFIDPPYKSDYAEKSIKMIVDNELLNNDGMIIWEHDKTKLDIIDTISSSIKASSRTKKYGIKYLTIFEF